MPRHLVCLKVLVWAEDATLPLCVFPTYLKTVELIPSGAVSLSLSKLPEPGIVKHTICETNWKPQNALNFDEKLCCFVSDGWIQERLQAHETSALNCFFGGAPSKHDAPQRRATRQQPDGRLIFPADSDPCWAVNRTPLVSTLHLFNSCAEHRGCVPRLPDSTICMVKEAEGTAGDFYLAACIM